MLVDRCSRWCCVWLKSSSSKLPLWERGESWTTEETGTWFYYSEVSRHTEPVNRELIKHCKYQPYVICKSKKHVGSHAMNLLGDDVELLHCAPCNVCCCSLSTWCQAYLIACVWNCYRYVSGRGTSEILLYVTTNDTTVSHLFNCSVMGSTCLKLNKNCTFVLIYPQLGHRCECWSHFPLSCC